MEDGFVLPRLPNINKLNNNYMISELSREEFNRITSDILRTDIESLSLDEIREEIFAMIQEDLTLDEDVMDLYYYLLDL